MFIDLAGTLIACTINCSLRRSISDHHPVSSGDQCWKDKEVEGEMRQKKDLNIYVLLKKTKN